MFFKSANVDVNILSVIEMGWQRVNARAGYRPFHTLSYRLVGDAVFFSGAQEVLRVNEGEIGFFPAGYDFSKQAGKGRIVAVHFSSPSQLPDEILSFTPKNPLRFRSEFEKLHQIWKQKNPGYEYESKILLYRIMLEMEREWSADQKTATAQHLSGILEYINEHFSSSALSVTELTQMAGVSDTYLRKLFVAEYGMTPQKYINHLRLTAATELLQSGYYSISEIASRCGFNNINYFSAFIKKETGLSPLSYRKHLLDTISAVPISSAKEL